MLTIIRESIKDPAIYRRVLYTLGIIALLRLLAITIIPTIDRGALVAIKNPILFEQLNIVSGSALTSFSVVSLGLSPYISSSIIVQFLQMGLSPRVKEWSESGRIGRNKITLLTRVLTFIFAITQTMSLLALLSFFGQIDGLLQLGTFEKSIMFLSLITGALVTNFLADKITERGIGNGMSIVIVIGILANLPKLSGDLFVDVFVNTAKPWQEQLPIFLLIVGIILGLIFITTLFQQANYHIPIQSTASIHRGASYLPIKLNPAGVMPVIFTGLVLSITNYLPMGWLKKTLEFIFDGRTPHGTLLFVLITIGFSILYGLVQVNPEKTAASLGRSNTYILNIRPGIESQKFLGKIVTRLSILGGIFLAIISLTPRGMENIFHIDPAFSLFGTSLLIMVGAAIDTINQLEGLTLQNNYKPIIK